MGGILVVVAISGIACGVYTVVMNGIWKKKVDEKTKLVKDAEAQIVHMEKMASLGTLAAGIAHEINNPLGFLISNLQSLIDYTQQIEGKISLAEKENKVLIEDMKAMNQESLDGAVRIKKIVSDLRTFSRRSETQNSLIEINQVLESVLSIVWNEIKYKVTVIKDYQAKSKISADTTQLSQVFLNLLINASQAIADKGTITMSTYEDAKSVYVKVVDTGSGIAKDVLPKIFDPFFSTKKSTGLGLSVSYNIIKHHGGDVKVESTVGTGTTFVVQLPRAPQG
ncbi:MAG: ATP-binding protein [Candidatus Omnitrophota bacterium]